MDGDDRLALVVEVLEKRVADLSAFFLDAFTALNVDAITGDDVARVAPRTVQGPDLGWGVVRGPAVGAGGSSPPLTGRRQAVRVRER